VPPGPALALSAPGGELAVQLFDVHWQRVAGLDRELPIEALYARGVRHVCVVATGAHHVEVGPIRFHALERGGRLAVRVRDRENPARRTLGPIPSFPVSAAWRLEARFEPATPPRRIPFPSVVGTIELETCPGSLLFSAERRELRVDPVLERGETDWWIVFGDRTNGVETYGGGRFVYAPPPVDGRTILDFNKAYNPPCVFTPYSTCPLPPPQNRLPIRIQAGERTYPAAETDAGTSP